MDQKEAVLNEVIGPCPEGCGGEIHDTGTLFWCSRRRRSKANPVSCKFRLWRNALVNFGKAKISPAEMAELLAGRSVRLELRAGTRYGILERAPGGGWWIGLRTKDPINTATYKPSRVRRGA